MTTIVEKNENESVDEFMSRVSDGADIEYQRKELEVWTKIVKGSPERFFAATTVSPVSGHRADPGSCGEVSDDALRRISMDFVRLCIIGTQVNGKTNNWTNGCWGSRWMDMNPKKYGVDYIRAAFYSKKNFKGEWKGDKPFLVQIMIEKARNRQTPTSFCSSSRL